MKVDITIISYIIYFDYITVIGGFVIVVVFAI